MLIFTSIQNNNTQKATENAGLDVILSVVEEPALNLIGGSIEFIRHFQFIQDLYGPFVGTQGDEKKVLRYFECFYTDLTLILNPLS